MADIIRRGGAAKYRQPYCSIFMILVPFLGVFIYGIVNGKAMSERDIAAAQQRESDFQDYVRQTANTTGGAGGADELTKLAALRDQGVLTDEEFSAQKAKLLA